MYILYIQYIQRLLHACMVTAEAWHHILTSFPIENTPVLPTLPFYTIVHSECSPALEHIWGHPLQCFGGNAWSLHPLDISLDSSIDRVFIHWEDNIRTHCTRKENYSYHHYYDTPTHHRRDDQCWREKTDTVCSIHVWEHSLFSKHSRTISYAHVYVRVCTCMYVYIHYVFHSVKGDTTFVLLLA